MGEKTQEALIEHACGHLARAAVWADEVARKRQLAKLEALACEKCMAAGWQARPQPQKR